MEKIVLFDGSGLKGWKLRDGSPAAWDVHDGMMTVTHGDILTEEEFGDVYFHVEFMEPDMPNESGQGKGNSGVYIQGAYEIQVLDSYGIEPPSKSDCGAIYQLIYPLANACKPPLTWQTYDIIFRTARFEGTGLVEPARLTLLHNGVVIHNNAVLHRNTPGGVKDYAPKEGPLLLQDHGNPVSFRNIWFERL